MMRILKSQETVLDGNGHTTTYIYNDFNQLTEVIDPIGKETHYGYDAAGRRESVAAGVNGDFDPVRCGRSLTAPLRRPPGLLIDGLLIDMRVRWQGTRTEDHGDRSVEGRGAVRDRPQHALEKVRYHAGQSYYDAEYFYDGSGRLERIED